MNKARFMRKSLLHLPIDTRVRFIFRSLPEVGDKDWTVDWIRERSSRSSSGRTSEEEEKNIPLLAQNK